MFSKTAFQYLKVLNRIFYVIFSFWIFPLSLFQLNFRYCEKKWDPLSWTKEGYRCNRWHSTVVHELLHPQFVLSTSDQIGLKVPRCPKHLNLIPSKSPFRSLEHFYELMTQDWIIAYWQAVSVMNRINGAWIKIFLVWKGSQCQNLPYHPKQCLSAINHWLAQILLKPSHYEECQRYKTTDDESSGKHVLLYCLTPDWACALELIQEYDSAKCHTGSSITHTMVTDRQTCSCVSAGGHSASVSWLWNCTVEQVSVAGGGARSDCVRGVVRNVEFLEKNI